MRNLRRSFVRQGLRPLVSLALITGALTWVSAPSQSGSYKVTLLDQYDVGPDWGGGYICGFDKYVYVSRGDGYSIVDVIAGRTRGPFKPDPFEPSVVTQHGKACLSYPTTGERRIHLILPNKTTRAGDASIWIMDVHDWNEDPILKGKIKSDDLDESPMGGSFYSAFVDTSRIMEAGEPVWVFAASNTCPDYPHTCNDTVYIFDIREILDASKDDPSLPLVIEEPGAIWYPGINPGFPPGPDSARGHDVTVHEDRLLVTNPGGGLYVLDTNPLFDQMTHRPPMELARCEYLNPMTHDAWATEDLRYVFTSDEYFFVWGCARPIGDVTVYDMLGTPGQDLCQRQVAKYLPSTAVTSHYVYVTEGLGYVANYSRGLRIIDVSVPADPIEVGYYDTYLGPDIPAYVFGTVDVWPFYDNYISALDHYQGVFVLQFEGADAACQGGVVQSTADQSPIDGA